MSGHGLAQGLADGPKERGNDGHADDGVGGKNSESCHAHVEYSHRWDGEIEDDPRRNQVQDANLPLERFFQSSQVRGQLRVSESA